jgi:UPF0755 protein
MLWRARLPYQGFREPVTIQIARGTSTRQIAALLARNGVIRDPWSLLVLRLVWPARPLQAGEYRFDKPATLFDVFRKLTRGDVHFYELTIPEGSNLFDVAAAVEKLGLISSASFRHAASDSSLIRDIDPLAKDLEGYLFPSTYRLTRQTTAAQLCKMMTGEFRAAWSKLGTREPSRDVVTLASLIEKETGDGAERPLVASVLQNRLAKGIKLECDPTAIYAALLENRYDGVINRSDLESNHPYNTYRHAGLPPGPIASPGLAALEAAIKPAQTAYLYFVAKPDGSRTHQFSRTVREHERAVVLYRRGQNNHQTKPARPMAGR